MNKEKIIIVSNTISHSFKSIGVFGVVSSNANTKIIVSCTRISDSRLKKNSLLRVVVIAVEV